MWKELNNELISCKSCPRLVAWREKVAREKRHAYKDQEYWGKPVPGFGDRDARILIVGLAPGAHGSNRTGRMFTGDASGDFLYPALYRVGFANQLKSNNRYDNLLLVDVFITAVCRCVPPKNKPTREEMENCRSYLLEEIKLLKNLEGIVVLGRIAFNNILKIYAQTYQISLNQRMKFSHGAFKKFSRGVPWLLVSYHPSRQNTQTGRLSVEMFDNIWQQAKSLIA